MTKVLLVEDDKSLREIYGIRLVAEGYDIISAGDGEEALALAVQERPSLIISDVMMPKISGFDMLDILRQTQETKDIKVIMMTALSNDDQRQRGESLGADRYLVKSQVGIEDVINVVHEVLGDRSGQSAPSSPVQQPVVNNSQQPIDITTPSPQPAPAPTPVAPAMPPQPATMSPVAAIAPAPTPVAPASRMMASPPTQSQNPNASAETGIDDMSPQQPASSLPQPVAPFSSPRPANLGERVISPIDDMSQLEQKNSSLENRIESELSDNPVVAPQVAQQPQPQPQPQQQV